MLTSPLILDLTCLALALCGAAPAVAVRSPGESSPALFAATLCAVPLLLGAARRVPAGRLWAPVAGLGVALLVLGLVGNAGRDVLALAGPGTPLRLVAYEAAATTAPPGWAAGGVALLLAGLALRTADRVLGVLADGIGVLLSAAVAAVLLARSVAASTSSVIPGRNAIVDPSPLGTVPTLLVLDLFGNRIEAVDGLADAPLLQELQLGADPLTYLRPLLRTTSLSTSASTRPTAPA